MFFNLGARWDEWSTPRPGLFTPGKDRLPLYKSVDGPQGRPGRVRKILPPPHRYSISGPYSRQQVAIPTTLVVVAVVMNITSSIYAELIGQRKLRTVSIPATVDQQLRLQSTFISNFASILQLFIIHSQQTKQIKTAFPLSAVVLLLRVPHKHHFREVFFEDTLPYNTSWSFIKGH